MAPTAPQMDAGDVLTLRDASAFLGVTRRTLRRWATADPASGVRVPLPTHRCGGRVFILRRELITWLAAHGPDGVCSVEDTAAV